MKVDRILCTILYLFNHDHVPASYLAVSMLVSSFDVQCTGIYRSCFF